MAAASQATGSSRPHRKMDLAPPAAAYPARVLALRRGALRRCPGRPAGLDGTDTTALILCAVSPDGRAHAFGSMPMPAACPSSTWRRVEASFTTFSFTRRRPNPRTEGPSRGRTKCRRDTAAGAPAPAPKAGCPDPAAAAAAATHHRVGVRAGYCPSPVPEPAARWQA